jgi:hypothetical protein
MQTMIVVECDCGILPIVTCMRFGFRTIFTAFEAVNTIQFSSLEGNGNPPDRKSALRVYSTARPTFSLFARSSGTCLKRFKAIIKSSETHKTSNPTVWYDCQWLQRLGLVFTLKVSAACLLTLLRKIEHVDTSIQHGFVIMENVVCEG